MRVFLIAPALMIASVVTSVPSSAEIIYPWCLQSTRGARNCGFVSQQQCMASRSGNADMCMVNGMYQQPLPGDTRYGEPRRPRPRG